MAKRKNSTEVNVSLEEGLNLEQRTDLRFLRNETMSFRCQGHGYNSSHYISAVLSLFQRGTTLPSEILWKVIYDVVEELSKSYTISSRQVFEAFRPQLEWYEQVLRSRQ